MARKYDFDLTGKRILITKDPSCTGREGQTVTVENDTSVGLDYYMLNIMCASCSCVSPAPCNHTFQEGDFQLLENETLVALDEGRLARSISDGLINSGLLNNGGGSPDYTTLNATVDTHSIKQGMKEGMEDSVGEIMSQVITHMDELERRRNAPPPIPKANIKPVSQEDEDFYL